MTDPATLLEQLDTTFQKILDINATDEGDAKHAIKEILQRFVISCKDTVTWIHHFDTLHSIDQNNARIRILNSVAMKNGQEIQPPMDRCNIGQPIHDFPKRLLEFRSMTAERRIALLRRFGVSEEEARGMGEEAGMLALRVWSGCGPFW
ncbi:MAG: hypothetical protein ALECFALPRED_001593 [Alectoria fallacina]|uniref:Uncharacterized protein n=1 Tax=Alectoria fallacina TaxID=1903189 RepID=A0A8H3IJ29_9LECA|nr:MAG: hypothetical protein ALECFALPRED_001593 [Alectoria fallacina]